MLYFSKLRIIIISIITIFFLFISLSNFLNTEDKFFSNKINLGLDLQGGSYLLLEIDNDPVELQKLQNTATDIRNFLNKENIKFIDLRIFNKSIIFNVDPTLKEKIESFFMDKDSEINPYYPQYKSHQFDLISSNNEFQLKLSDYGLVEIKTSSQDQAIEIVRRRVDEVGTNEPNILKRGNDRILVELPGLDDPMRIKSLLGKTANLSFRFITQNDNDTFGAEILKYDDEINEASFISSSYLRISAPKVSLSFCVIKRKLKLAVFPNKDFILIGSSKPGNSTKILSFPLFRIFGSFVPTSSTLLLTISIA